MQKTTRRWLPVLALLALGTAIDAQKQPARPGGPPVPAPSQQRVRERAVEAGAPRTRAPSLRRREAVQTMLQAEEHFRSRLARMNRMEQLFRQQGRMERVQQLEPLRARVQALHQVRVQDCRSALGEGDYLRLRDRIQQHDTDRRLQQDRDRDRDRTRTP